MVLGCRPLAPTVVAQVQELLLLLLLLLLLGTLVEVEEEVGPDSPVVVVVVAVVPKDPRVLRDLIQATLEMWAHS